MTTNTHTNIKFNCECGNTKNYYINPHGYIICPVCGLIQYDIYTPANIIADILEKEKETKKENNLYMAWLNSTL